MRSLMLAALLSVLPWFQPTFAGSAEMAPTATLAVMPSAPSADIRAQWSPFVDRLSRETGIAISLMVYEKIESFEKDVEKGIPDLVLAHPIQTVAARREQGYEPLVRGGSAIRALVFVRRDSPVISPKDLARKTIAMVGARNVCALLVRQELAGGEGIHYRFRFAGSGANVVRDVLSGKAEAGAALASVLEAESAETRDQLRTVLATPAVAPHPLSAHPRVPPKVQADLTAAILRMGGDPEGQAMLKAVRLTAPVKADYAKDYSPLEGVDNSIMSAEE